MKRSHSVFPKILIWIIAAACLIWVMYGVRVDELARHMRGLRLWWILPALTLDVLSTIVHGLRWQFLLRPAGEVSWHSTVKAIYAGLFVNEILPMRTGEFVRGYLVSRWMGIPFVAVLPSMITERVFDGSVLVIGLGVMAVFVSLPHEIAVAGVIVGGAMLLAIGALVALVLFKKHRPDTSSTNAGRSWKGVRHLVAFISRFAGELRSVWKARYLVPAVTVSFAFLSLQVMSFWMVMKAYGLPVSFWVPVVVLIMVRIGTAVPNAPANIGPHQFFCVLSLTLWGFDKTTATGFAIVLFVVLTIPLLTLGLFAFVRSGLKMSEIREARAGFKRATPNDGGAGQSM
ncbi:MAG: flippase-like domain-containing protein [Candidatus Latescibacterota bacterium]|nr:MAG: flippase-like domain-containing protein [Candidatus Latescibacterota bacterium]